MRWVVFLLLLVACSPIAPKISERIDFLQLACMDACDEEQKVTVLLPEKSTLYTTEEAICIKAESKLYCGTCTCLFPTELMNTEEETNVSCTFGKEKVSCEKI